MGIPTTFSVGMVNDLFFNHIKELSIRSLKDIKDGSLRRELRLQVADATGPRRPLSTWA